MRRLNEIIILSRNGERIILFVVKKKEEEEKGFEREGFGDG